MDKDLIERGRCEVVMANEAKRLDTCTCGDLGRDPECEVHGGPNPYDGVTLLGAEHRDRRWRFVETVPQHVHSTSGVYAWKNGGWTLGEHPGWVGWKPVGPTGADLAGTSIWTTALSTPNGRGNAVAEISFDAQRLRQAVEAAPDYADAMAEANRLYAIKQQADEAYRAAAAVVGAIRDREAEQLFGPPPSLNCGFSIFDEADDAP